LILDGKTAGSDPIPDFDVCVVGTGLAGETVVREFIDSEFSVCILESGNYYTDIETQSLKYVRSDAYPIDFDSRERQLGGTTNTWGQGCMPLEPIDFERRDWVPNSGWPINREDIEEYYNRASKVLRIPDMGDFGDVGYEKFLENENIHTRFSYKTRRHLKFDDSLVAKIEKSANVHLYLNSNVVELIPSKDEDEIICMKVNCLNGVEFEVQAGIFVLACGGIENAKLLLQSDSRNPNGIGNEHDQVGRYFMEHPKGIFGEIINMKKSDLRPYEYCNEKSMMMIGGLCLSREIQEKNRILNSHVRLVPEYNLGGRLLRSAGFEKARMKRLWIKNYMEMTPDPENRVYLTDERDLLDCRIAAVKYNVGDIDRKTMAMLHDVLEKELRELNFGDCKFGPLDSSSGWPITQDSSHHAGTTRMGREPDTSVVDPDCRVHGMKNLYIAGSSVFPTSGYAGPTYTLMALSYRLADFLQDLLSRGRDA